MADINDKTATEVAVTTSLKQPGVEELQDPAVSKKYGTQYDRRDMNRMGRRQQLRVRSCGFGGKAAQGLTACPRSATFASSPSSVMLLFSEVLGSLLWCTTWKLNTPMFDLC